MEITPEQQEEAFNKASKTQKKLYSTADSGKLLHEICLKQNIEDKKIPFFVAVGDVILGLVPQEKLPELLVERLRVERPASMRITADVLDFLAPLDQPQATETASVVPINSPEPANDNSLASEIAEAEAAMETMQPIRTMSHDMEVMRETAKDEPTHTAASQADILNRSTAKQETPADTRWGTEQT